MASAAVTSAVLPALAAAVFCPPLAPGKIAPLVAQVASGCVEAVGDALAPLPDDAYGYTAPERHMDAAAARLVPAAWEPRRKLQVDLGLTAQEVGFGQRLGHGWDTAAYVRHDDENGMMAGVRFTRRW
jgi:hypothetical protein